MFGRLWTFIRPYWGWWVGSALAILGSVTCSLAIPRLVGAAIDDLRTGSPPGTKVGHYALLIVVAAAGAGLLTVAMRAMGPVAARKVAVDLRAALFRRLALLEPAFFHRYRTGDLINRYGADVDAVQDLVGFGAVGFMNMVLSIGTTLYFMVRISTKLGFIILGAFPIIFGIIVLMLRAATRRYLELQQMRSALSSRVQENVSGVRLIRVSAAEAREERAFGEVQSDYARKVLRHAQVHQPLPAFARLLLNLVFVAALLLFARMFLTGGDSSGLSLGGFVAFITYLFLLLTPMIWFGMVVDSMQQGIVSFRRLLELLDAEPAIKSGARELPAPRGEVKFDGVSLEIDGRPLLKGVSFTIPPGKTIAVTGRTGSGKSLLAALLARQLDPSSGRVLVDGTDVKELKLDSLRAALALVPQEPILFSRSVRENIELGLEPDLERVKWAATVANLIGEVDKFPNGFDTLVGERGVSLSGGQRQRTALARALARKAQVLILDDALSAVDAETESKILNELKTSLAGRSVLVIGHRVATLRHADEILVLENGQIVERGTHAELIARAGPYAELDRKQRLAESLELNG